MREKMIKNVIITALLLCLVGSVSAEPGLVAYYPFDGNANDESGNGNDGTVNGATYVSGVSGQALSFDGVDDYISRGRLLGGTTFSAYSHEGWFKLNNIPSGNERYFIFSDETTDGQIVSAVWSDGKLHLSHHDGSTWVEILSLSEFSIGKWYHYATTWDGETLKLFIDGNLENSISVSLLSTPSPSLDISIGRLKYWFDQNIENKGLFYGTIDEVKIYNRARSASEIQANYDAVVINPKTQSSGLVAHYPFEGNAQDSSGNGNDGTVYGATLTEDRFGNADSAYSFDGVEDRINIPNHIISSITLTLNLWVKTDDNTYALISGANANFNNEYLLYVHSSYGSKLEIYYHDDQGYTGNGFYLTNIITNDNLWHMITIVTKVDETKIYIDGLLEETADYGSESNFDIEGLWLGAEQDCVNGCWNTIQQFNGVIDDVRIYNRALSASEIQANYDAIMDPTTTTTIPTTTTTVPITTAPPTSAPSPSVYLYAKKTEVEVGEDISLILSAVNIMKNQEMTVQLILEVPSGMSVTGGSGSGAGQYTNRYVINPGEQKYIPINIETNQVGDFDIIGEIYYYLENESTPKPVPIKPLPVVVRAKQQVVPNEEVPSELATGPPPEENGNKRDKGGVCGPTALLLLVALPLGVYSLLRRRW